MSKEPQDKRPPGGQSTFEGSFEEAAVRVRGLISMAEHNIRIMVPRFEPSILDLVTDVLQRKMLADAMLTVVASAGMEKNRLDDSAFFRLRHETHFQLLVARTTLKERLMLVDMRHGYLELRADPEQCVARYAIFLNLPRTSKEWVGKFSAIANRSERYRDRPHRPPSAP